MGANDTGARDVDTRCVSIAGVTVLVVSFPALPDSLPEDLSAAEREVLRCLLRGDSYAEIATRRRTAMRTTANQVASIFRKVGVASRGELAARLSR